MIAEQRFLCVRQQNGDRCVDQCRSCFRWEVEQLCQELQTTASFLHSRNAHDGAAAVDRAIRLLLGQVRA